MTATEYADVLQRLVDVAYELATIRTDDNKETIDKLLSKIFKVMDQNLSGMGA